MVTILKMHNCHQLQKNIIMNKKDRNRNRNSEKPRRSRDNSVTECDQVEDKKKEYSATKIRK